MAAFMLPQMVGSMWWIIDNRLRAANSAFMTDNKCELPNWANWSVLFWNGKMKRKKEFIGNNCDIVSTLYYASPPCKITAMNLLKNQTRYISHVYDFGLACYFYQSDQVSHTLRKIHQECVYWCANHTEICVRSNNSKWSMVENHW